MPATVKQLLAPLVGLLLVAACAAPSAPATTASTAPSTTAPAVAAPTTPPKTAVSPPPSAPPAAVPPSAAAPPKPANSPAAPPGAAEAASVSAAKPAAGPVSGEIVVFAAASLTDVFQDMATAFQQANPNAKLTFNFGASSQLATQLGQGAKADIFASADQTQMDNARKASAIGGMDTVFARNRLVVITPKDNPKHIAAVKDLADDGLKFVTAQPTVPIGQYTAQMLDKAAADPAYGADFKSKVVANTVSREDNVRQVVSKVQLGEADAAVVYSTDATPQVRDRLQIIQVPDPLQTLATYSIAVARGDNAAAGEAFAAYVVGSAGQATLAKWGFLPPTATTPAAALVTPSTAGSSPPPTGAAAPAAAPIPAVASSTFRHLLS